MPVYAITGSCPAGGRTTTAVGLASYLGSFGARVLLVDLDPAGDATAALGHAHGMDLVHAMRHDQPVQGCAAPGRATRVDVLAASPTLSAVDQHMPDVEQRLTSVLRDLGGRYSYTFIDCPREDSVVTRAALAAASAVILVVPCEDESVTELSEALAALETMRAEVNPHLRTVLLLTMRDSSAGSTRVAAEARQMRPGGVFTTSIPVDETLEAILDGANMLDLRSPGAHAYQRVALELADHATTMSA